MSHHLGGLLDFLSHLWIIYVGIGLLIVTVIVAAIVVTPAVTPATLLDDNNLRLWLLYNNTRLLLRIVLWVVLRHNDLWLLLRDVYGLLLCVCVAVCMLPQQGSRNARQCALFTCSPSVS
jgi:hypothetical protein